MQHLFKYFNMERSIFICIFINFRTVRSLGKIMKMKHNQHLNKQYTRNYNYVMHHNLNLPTVASMRFKNYNNNFLLSAEIK